MLEGGSCRRRESQGERMSSLMRTGDGDAGRGPKGTGGVCWKEKLGSARPWTALKFKASLCRLQSARQCGATLENQRGKAGTFSCFDPMSFQSYQDFKALQEEGIVQWASNRMCHRVNFRKAPLATQRTFCNLIANVRHNLEPLQSYPACKV